MRALKDRKYPLPVSIFDVLGVIDEVLAGMGVAEGGGGEVFVNTLLKLWTVYSWLAFQFSTVQYIYVANLTCMAAK